MDVCFCQACLFTASTRGSAKSGIAKSKTTTSGFSSSNFSTPDSPLLASPQIVQSREPSSTRRIRRVVSESSTTSTRNAADRSLQLSFFMTEKAALDNTANACCRLRLESHFWLGLFLAAASQSVCCVFSHSTEPTSVIGLSFASVCSFPQLRHTASPAIFNISSGVSPLSSEYVAKITGPLHGGSQLKT
jgi:hypothetical protein